MQIDLVQQPFSAKGVRVVEHSLHKSFLIESGSDLPPTDSEEETTPVFLSFPAEF